MTLTGRCGFVAVIGGLRGEVLRLWAWLRNAGLRVKEGSDNLYPWDWRVGRGPGSPPRRVRAGVRKGCRFAQGSERESPRVIL